MNRRIGVAVVGCGHRPHAWSYARALSSSSTATLVGIFDQDADLGHSVADDFEAPYWSDLDSVWTCEQVEAVVVCSPTVAHRELLEQAAAHGLHVLCEKPIATTLDDARAMVAACRGAGVQLHTAFVTRFHPLVAHVRDALTQGRLGDPIAMVAGNRGRPPLPPGYPAWITSRQEAGGGALIDHSVHLSDVIRHLSGREVVSVTAEVGAQLWSCGVDDVALVSLVFEGGMVASLDPSWSVPENNPWDYDFTLRLVGTQGALTVTDLAESLQLVSSMSGGGQRLVPFGEDVDTLMIEAFVASIAAGEVLSPCATGEDGLRALEIALAAYASAASRTRVMLPFESG